MSDTPEEQRQAAVRRSFYELKKGIDWLLMAEVYADSAKRIRMKYDELVKQGFTKEQALDLCWRSW